MPDALEELGSHPRTDDNHGTVRGDTESALPPLDRKVRPTWITAEFILLIPIVTCINDNNGGEKGGRGEREVGILESFTMEPCCHETA